MGIPWLNLRYISLIVKDTSMLNDYERAILHHERGHAQHRHDEKIFCSSQR